MLLGSMNLYDFSERRSWEMGLMFDFAEEPDQFQIFNDVLYEIEAMIALHEDEEGARMLRAWFENFTEFEFLEKSVKVSGKEISNERFMAIHKDCNVKNGYCIRCRAEIQYNTLKPYCPKCFRSYLEKRSKDVPEEYCHRCSRYSGETMLGYSQCDECASIFAFEVHKILHVENPKYDL